MNVYLAGYESSSYESWLGGSNYSEVFGIYTSLEEAKADVDADIEDLLEKEKKNIADIVVDDSLFDYNPLSLKKATCVYTVSVDYASEYDDCEWSVDYFVCEVELEGGSK